jgi:hypothetical protein
MTDLLIINIFGPYNISSEKDFEPRRSHFSKVSGSESEKDLFQKSGPDFPPELMHRR